MDEETNTGNDKNHDHGELVKLQVKARPEIARDNPVKEFLAKEVVATGEEFTHRFQRAGEGEARGAKPNPVDRFVRPLRTKQAIDGGAQQRQQRNDPEMFEYRH